MSTKLTQMYTEVWNKYSQISWNFPNKIAAAACISWEILTLSNPEIRWKF